MKESFHCFPDDILCGSKSSLSLIDDFYIDNKNNEILDSTDTCNK